MGGNGFKGGEAEEPQRPYAYAPLSTMEVDALLCLDRPWDVNRTSEMRLKDIEKLKDDPGYATWCQKVNSNSLSDDLGAIYQLAAAEVENLRQENQHLADMVAWRSEN